MWSSAEWVNVIRRFVYYNRQESEDCQLKVSQIHLKLGELGLETEQYAQSVIDFTTCLQIQKKFLDPDCRLIAGTYPFLNLLVLMPKSIHYIVHVVYKR